MFEGSVSAKAEKISQPSVGNMAAKGRPGGLGSRFPTCLFHLELDKFCPSEAAPDRATLTLLCIGRLLLARGCQIHFDVGLSWGFMLSEKFPPLPFT